jgi:hypothetical protein
MRANRIKFRASLLLFIIFVAGVQFAIPYAKKFADLTVTNLSSNTTVKVGAAIQNVVAEITNQGKRPAAAFRIKYFLSPNQTFSADDFDTATVCEFAELGKNKSVDCKATIPIPASFTPGQYYLIAVVDEQNTVAEKDESNNAKAFGLITIEKAKVDDEDPPPPLPKEGITVDGDPGDWQTITPLYTDEAGDGPFDSSGIYQAGSDITHISVTNDNQNVYFLIEFAGLAYQGGLLIFLDTDVNPATGCGGSEAAIFASAIQPKNLLFGDYRNCELNESVPLAVTTAVAEKENHSYMEASISIEDLFRITAGRRDFRFYARTRLGGVTDEVWPPTVYSLTSHYADGANLQIDFDSETVLPDDSRPCGAALPGWHYGISLTETKGVGVTITGFKSVLYDINGGYLMTIGTNSGDDFARLFTDCGTGGAYINPFGKVCSQSLCLNLGGRSGGQLDLTFSGIDDKGYQVRFTSGRLILHSR